VTVDSLPRRVLAELLGLGRDMASDTEASRAVGYSLPRRVLAVLLGVSLPPRMPVAPGHKGDPAVSAFDTHGWRSNVGEVPGQGFAAPRTSANQVRDMRFEVSANLIEDIYREILEPSFGPNELATLDAVLDGLAEGGSDEVWGLCALEGETPVGCVLGYPYRESGVLLIAYLSVKPGFRGRGIGDLLMEEAQRRWYGTADLVVAEIADPRHQPVVGGIDPKQCAAFYARRGAQVVVGPYFRPRLEGEGKKRIYDLFLIVLSGSGPDNSVPGGKLADFLLEYFRASGDSENWPLSEDAEVNRLLAWYRSRQMVRMNPIAEYAQIEFPRLN